jgi:hypothetical protein
MLGRSKLIEFTIQMETNNSRTLKRYTDITSLISILVTKKITLIDPLNWDDKNDSYFMSAYKRHKNLKSLLATCFTSAPETYHHWKIFSGNDSGVCIVFLNTQLQERIRGNSELKSDYVEYKTLAELENASPEINNLPFTKRYPFKDEKEFRIIYESASEDLSFYDLDIELKDIDRIFLSPWLHPALANNVKLLLKSISGCDKLKITRSTLIGNENWKKFAN